MPDCVLFIVCSRGRYNFALSDGNNNVIVVQKSHGRTDAEPVEGLDGEVVPQVGFVAFDALEWFVGGDGDAFAGVDEFDDEFVGFFEGALDFAENDGARDHFVGFVEFEVRGKFLAIGEANAGFVLVANKVAAGGRDFIEGNAEGQRDEAGDEHLAPSVLVRVSNLGEFAGRTALPFDGVNEVMGLAKVEGGRGGVGLEDGSGVGEVDGGDGFGFDPGNLIDLDIDLGLGALAGAVNEDDGQSEAKEDEGKDELLVVVANDVTEVAKLFHDSTIEHSTAKGGCQLAVHFAHFIGHFVSRQTASLRYEGKGRGRD